MLALSVIVPASPTWKPLASSLDLRRLSVLPLRVGQAAGVDCDGGPRLEHEEIRLGHCLGQLGDDRLLRQLDADQPAWRPFALGRDEPAQPAGRRDRIGSLVIPEPNLMFEVEQRLPADEDMIRTGPGDLARDVNALELHLSLHVAGRGIPDVELVKADAGQPFAVRAECECRPWRGRQIAGDEDLTGRGIEHADLFLGGERDQLAIGAQARHAAGLDWELVRRPQRLEVPDREPAAAGAGRQPAVGQERRPFHFAVVALGVVIGHPLRKLVDGGAIERPQFEPILLIPAELVPPNDDALAIIGQGERCELPGHAAAADRLAGRQVRENKPGRSVGVLSRPIGRVTDDGPIRGRADDQAAGLLKKIALGRQANDLRLQFVAGSRAPTASRSPRPG